MRRRAGYRRVFSSKLRWLSPGGMLVINNVGDAFTNTACGGSGGNGGRGFSACGGLEHQGTACACIAGMYARTWRRGACVCAACLRADACGRGRTPHTRPPACWWACAQDPPKRARGGWGFCGGRNGNRPSRLPTGTGPRRRRTCLKVEVLPSPSRASAMATNRLRVTSLPFASR